MCLWAIFPAPRNGPERFPSMTRACQILSELIRLELGFLEAGYIPKVREKSRDGLESAA